MSSRFKRYLPPPAMPLGPAARRRHKRPVGAARPSDDRRHCRANLTENDGGALRNDPGSGNCRRAETAKSFMLDRICNTEQPTDASPRTTTAAEACCRTDRQGLAESQQHPSGHRLAVCRLWEPAAWRRDMPTPPVSSANPCSGSYLRARTAFSGPAAPARSKMCQIRCQRRVFVMTGVAD